MSPRPHDSQSAATLPPSAGTAPCPSCHSRGAGRATATRSPVPAVQLAARPEGEPAGAKWEGKTHCPPGSECGSRQAPGAGLLAPVPPHQIFRGVEVRVENVALGTRERGPLTGAQGVRPALAADLTGERWRDAHHRDSARMRALRHPRLVEVRHRTPTGCRREISAKFHVVDLLHHQRACLRQHVHHQILERRARSRIAQGFCKRAHLGPLAGGHRRLSHRPRCQLLLARSCRRQRRQPDIQPDHRTSLWHGAAVRLGKIKHDEPVAGQPNQPRAVTQPVGGHPDVVHHVRAGRQLAALRHRRAHPRQPRGLVCRQHRHQQRGQQRVDTRVLAVDAQRRRDDGGVFLLRDAGKLAGDREGAQLEFSVVYQVLGVQQLGDGLIDLALIHHVQIFLCRLQLAAGDGLLELRIRSAFHANHVVGGVLGHSCSCLTGRVIDSVSISTAFFFSSPP
ncbi:hypothetical protein BOO71_0003757 [Deinococcus marmoris]|uniref:Uncharacterized protein n=1 Tax=Deinococcus marmoris TaxID=249408 RepID=A0A1U7P1Q1_9DEIO|nr:hypothetical protein BOO71_0003757 [Deinococcus marmoris]